MPKTWAASPSPLHGEALDHPVKPSIGSPRSLDMKRCLYVLATRIPAYLLLLNLVVGWLVLPPMLLNAPMPSRTEAERHSIRARLCPQGCTWTSTAVPGGEDRPLRVWHLHRPSSCGVAVLLHGFGDDAWGDASRLQDLPHLDAVTFTFRNRDMDPGTPSTLGGWEPEDVVAVVNDLVAQGFPRQRIVLVGTSQGAGVALLALARLEGNQGLPLGGALLESPFESLLEAGRNHLRGTLGAAECLLRPAEALALVKAGRKAHFDPWGVSPRASSKGLRTPIALLAGDADAITPLAGVKAIAVYHPDLTVVHGAQHMEAGVRVAGGWRSWAAVRLNRWGFT